MKELVATLLFPFINTFLIKRRNKVRNSVKLIRFRVLELFMFLPPRYMYVQYMLHVHVQRPYACVACLFPTVFGSVHAHARIVLVQHAGFPFTHNAANSPTVPASPVTRNVLHQD